jgi:restriction system protein
MARRRTSTFEDLIEIASRLPWWGGCLFAFISYLVLHAFSATEVSTPANPQGISAVFLPMLFRTFAAFGQFLLPIAFLFGAFISLITQLKRRKNYLKVENYEPPNPLFAMSWQDFEEVVSEFFKRMFWGRTKITI